MKITTKGYIKLLREDGSQVSQHSQVKEAYESASEAGAGLYTITFPSQTVEIEACGPTDPPPVDPPPVDPPPVDPPPPGTFPSEPGSPAFKRDHGKAVMAPTYGSLPTMGEKRLYAPTGAEIKRVAPGLTVYSRYTPVSVDNKLIVIHGENSTSAKIYDRATGNVVRDLPNIGENNEIRWHYGMDTPSRFYYVKGMDLRQMDALTGADTLIRKFTVNGAAYICNDVEGDCSNDSRYWAFMAMATPNTGSYYPVEIFTYDRVSDVVLGKFVFTDFPQPADRPAGRMLRPNMVEISPDGSKCIVHWERAYSGNNGNLVGTIQDGPHAYNLSLDKATARKVAVDATHSGWIGTDWFVSQNNRNDWIEAVHVETGQVKQLLNHGDLGWNNGFHFTKDYANTGKVIVSTYSASNGVWGENQLIGLDLNGQVTRIAHTHNVFPGNDGYRNEAAAAVSFDGLGVYWTGNWGSGNRARDTYEVRLPAGW